MDSRTARAISDQSECVSIKSSLPSEALFSVTFQGIFFFFLFNMKRDVMRIHKNGYFPPLHFSSWSEQLKQICLTVLKRAMMSFA